MKTATIINISLGVSCAVLSLFLYSMERELSQLPPQIEAETNDAERYTADLNKAKQSLLETEVSLRELKQTHEEVIQNGRVELHRLEQDEIQCRKQIRETEIAQGKEERKLVDAKRTLVAYAQLGEVLHDSAVRKITIELLTPLSGLAPDDYSRFTNKEVRGAAEDFLASSMDLPEHALATMSSVELFEMLLSARATVRTETVDAI